MKPLPRSLGSFFVLARLMATALCMGSNAQESAVAKETTRKMAEMLRNIYAVQDWRTESE